MIVILYCNYLKWFHKQLEALLFDKEPHQVKYVKVMDTILLCKGPLLKQK